MFSPSNPPRLVVVDEDGTFLDLGGEEFSRERFSRVFAKMDKAGCRFAVATSNQSFQVKDIFGSLASQISLVTSNGAYVETDGELLSLSTLSPAAVGRVVEAHEKHPQIPLAAVCADGAYFETGANPDFAQSLAIYSHQVKFVDSLADAAATKDVMMYWSRMPAAQQRDSMAQLQDALGGDIAVVDSGVEDGWGFFDLVQPGVSKATGARVLLDHFGIDASQVMAFGDADNDIEMLELAGCGVAMGNASDKVKAHANLVCAPCREQGVLRVLEDVFGIENDG